MSVEVLDNNTIVDFIGDEEAFAVSVRELFMNLDSDHDGHMSYPEMLKEFQSLRVFENHFGIDESPSPRKFAKFDHDLNGKVDLEEFTMETRQMMLAMATGMGFLPVQMVLEENSLLKKAVEWESWCSSCTSTVAV